MKTATHNNCHIFLLKESYINLWNWSIPHTIIIKTHTKNEDLNIIHATIKLLKKNISKTFSDINYSNIFLGQSPKAIEIKAKINKET